MRGGILRLRHVRRLLLPLSRRHLPSAGCDARRLNGKYLAPRCAHLDERVEEIREGKFETLLEDLMGKPLAEMQELYNHREIEK